MSISAMPSTPKAEEIATVSPKVSNAHARTRSGRHVSTLAGSFLIASFTLETPHCVFNSSSTGGTGSHRMNRVNSTPNLRAGFKDSFIDQAAIGKSNDFADNQQRWRCELRGAREIRHRGAVNLLLGSRCATNNRARGFWSETGFCEPGGNLAVVRARHVDRERRFGSSEPAPIRSGIFRSTMTGCQHESRRCPTTG